MSRTAVGTFPEPSVFPILDCIKEVFADNVGLISDFLCTVLPANDIFEFCIVPTFHTLFLFLFPGASVGIDIFLSRFTLDCKIVGEFALVASFALPLFEIDASKNISYVESVKAYSTVLGSVPNGTFCGA
jgi:hypothetical protein